MLTTCFNPCLRKTDFCCLLTSLPGWAVILSLGQMSLNYLELVKKIQMVGCYSHSVLSSLTTSDNLFQLLSIHKATWMHPCSKNRHLIDYVIVKCWHIRDVQITRAVIGADCWTDHQLLGVKSYSIILSKHRIQKCQIVKKLDVKKLADPAITTQLEEQLVNQVLGVNP